MPARLTGTSRVKGPSGLNEVQARGLSPWPGILGLYPRSKPPAMRVVMIADRHDAVSSLSEARRCRMKIGSSPRSYSSKLKNF